MSNMKNLFYELIGTFLLVFIGTGSIILNQEMNGALGIQGIALSFGLAIALAIILFGKRSGAHINPAVTTGLVLMNAFSRKKLIPYILSQTAGAVIASFCLKLIYPHNNHLGITIPRGSVLESFVIEFAMTFTLMILVLFSTKIKDRKYLFGPALLIGIGIVPLIVYSGPISGGSFNPSRSIGPAIASGNYNALWIYIVATTLGAILAVFVWQKINRNTKALKV